jgi:hypothetical protein
LSHPHATTSFFTPANTTFVQKRCQTTENAPLDFFLRFVLNPSRGAIFQIRPAFTIKSNGERKEYSRVWPFKVKRHESGLLAKCWQGMVVFRLFSQR